ncbi:MAG: hypothetical protein LBR89_02105 [Holosporales bacterium]|nr:hypothetical protein [Holosporales bacterium]
MSLHTNLNASRLEMHELEERLLYIESNAKLNAVREELTPNELTIYWESPPSRRPTIYGDAAISRLGPFVKSELDRFLAMTLPENQRNDLVRYIATYITANSQSWLGIERYMIESIVKSGDDSRYVKVRILTDLVESYFYEQFEDFFSGDAITVLHCIKRDQPLPDVTATALARRAYEANYNWLPNWIHRTYAATVSPRTSDSEIEEKCQTCVTQLLERITSISKNDPHRLQVFMHRVSHFHCFTDLEPRSVDKYVWRAFLFEECPQLSLQKRPWPDAPQTWPDEWWHKWDDKFMKKVSSLLLGFSQHKTQYIIQSIDDVLPCVSTTSPPSLMKMYLRMPDLTDASLTKRIVYQAWMHAWKKTCQLYADIRPA